MSEALIGASIGTSFTFLMTALGAAMVIFFKNKQNEENIDDTILEQGANGYWANTTVVYGPIAQSIFRVCTLMAFKNIDVCLLIFKLLNLMIHITDCYLIYKLSSRQIIYVSI